MNTMRYQRAFIVCKILENFIIGWSGATYAFFYLEKGYELWHLTFVNSCFMLVAMLLDPWTGKLGDYLGQRTVYVTGLLFWGAGTFYYGFADNILQFVIAEWICAVGFALISQTLESWLENSLPNGYSAQIRGRAELPAKFAVIPSAIAGGIIGSSVGFHVPWLIEGAFSLIAAAIIALILIGFPSPDYSNESKIPLSIRSSWKETRANEALRFSVIFTIVATFSYQPLNMFWSDILKDASGGATWWQGLMWIPIGLGAGIGGHYTARITKVSKKHFIWLLLIPSVFILLAVIGAKLDVLVIVVLGFSLHEFPRGAFNNILFTWSNEHIRNDNRSTMNSIRSAARPLGSLLGLSAAGLLLLIGFTKVDIWIIISTMVPVIFACFIWLRK